MCIWLGRIKLGSSNVQMAYGQMNRLKFKDLYTRDENVDSMELLPLVEKK